MKRRQAKKIAKRESLKAEQRAEWVADVTASVNEKLREVLKRYIGQFNNFDTRTKIKDTLRDKLRFSTCTAENIRGKSVHAIFLDDYQDCSGAEQVPASMDQDKVVFNFFPEETRSKPIVFPLINNPETLLSTEYTRNQRLDAFEGHVTYVDKIGDMKPEENLCSCGRSAEKIENG